MYIKTTLPILAMTVAAITFTISYASAANVGISINGYLPAPPGVIIQVDAGRPYYVEQDRRVYMERERPAKHHKRKHHKEKHDNGNKYGHDQYAEHGEHGGGGHGR